VIALPHRIEKTICLILLSLACACGSTKSASEKSPSEEEEKPYELEYSDVMDFIRGVKTSYKIAGHFNGEQTSRLTIDGLPEGATYSEEALMWQPSCDLKPENGQFLRGYMVHRLRINLEGIHTDELVQKPAIIIIHKDGEDSICQD